MIRSARTFIAISSRNAGRLLLAFLFVALATWVLAQYPDHWREGIVIDCGVVVDNAGAPFYALPCP